MSEREDNSSGAVAPPLTPAAKEPAASAIAGPWRACKDGKCSCGQIWSVPFDAPIASVQHGPWGDRYPALRTVDASEGMSGTSVKIEAYMEVIEYGSISEDAAIQIRRLIAAAPELRDALAGMVGLVDLLLASSDTTPFLREILLTNHRATTARAVLSKVGT